ncbi:GMC oxidoreductase-domain-containing protein [Phaeosphaeriaceae sp. PMI808]|nr:GMC oxidoreductase-domain-containing protein [Phaeosphaeriaceae sp. PMI808]
MFSCLFALLLMAQHVLAAHTAFDYVIIGGGPAGLIVANHLSANPDITVAVVEAGLSAYNNPNVTTLPRTIAEFSPGIGTSIDWKYTSTPQKYTSNRSLSYYAGKALGGTTTINGMTYLRAEAAQIDAWEQLGNRGWNWSTMEPYYLTQETFQIPNNEQVKNGASYVGKFHGDQGELSIGFTPYLTGQGAFDVISQTSIALGIPTNTDANSGTMRGTTTWPSMLNVTGKIREDAARAFYWPIAESRRNLQVFLDTTATRISWDTKRTLGDKISATGVKVFKSGNTIKTIHATREVIVAAGSLRSPVLLEQSGIGDPKILEPLGIEIVIPFSNVGSNLMDQPANGIAYSSSTNWTGYPTFATYLTALDLFRTDLDSIRHEIQANISSYAAKILADYVHNATFLEAQEQLLKHQVELIFHPKSTVPLADILWVPFETNIFAQYWNLLPLSRGSVHIASLNRTTAPTIDPNFFQLPIDMYVQAAIAIRIREFFATAPLSQYVTSEISPGFETVPDGTTWRDTAWKTWIEKTYESNSHPVSTCAMRSRDLGGVVSAEGKVYGTKNISGHLTASVYAMAKRISESIISGIA